MKSQFSRNLIENSDENEKIEDNLDELPIRTRKVTKDYKNVAKPTPIKPSKNVVGRHLIKHSSLNQENSKKESNTFNSNRQQLINPGGSDSSGVRCMININDDTLEEHLFDFKENSINGSAEKKNQL